VCGLYLYKRLGDRKKEMVMAEAFAWIAVVVGVIVIIGFLVVSDTIQ
jgi:hypothetical protein